MASRNSNSTKNTYTVNTIFCESKEYFKAIATTHRFMRDVLMQNEKSIIKESNTAMIDLINKYINEPTILYSILRIAVVAAMNINIQYLDLNGNETNMLTKLYEFLCKNLLGKITMIDYVYELYEIEIPVIAKTSVIETASAKTSVIETASAKTSVIETASAKTPANVPRANVDSVRPRGTLTNTRRRAHGGNNKIL